MLLGDMKNLRYGLMSEKVKHTSHQINEGETIE